MKQKQATIIAVACGAVCALCVGAFLWSVQGQADAARAETLARYGGEQVEVCVATRDIAAGERLDASAVETKLWIADLLPEGALSDVAAIVGRTATSSILKGEVVSAKRFEEGRASLDIPAGLVAVSVPAKAVQAVGGAVSAGMSVDVYSSGGSGTSPLANDVIVLATSMGDPGSLAGADSGWVTLAVAPERVEEVIAASSKTNLYFALPGVAPEPASEPAEPQPDAAQAESSAAAEPAGSEPAQAPAEEKTSAASAASETADAGDESESGE